MILLNYFFEAKCQAKPDHLIRTWQRPTVRILGPGGSNVIFWIVMGWYCSFWSEGSKINLNLNMLVPDFVARDHDGALCAVIRGPWGPKWRPKVLCLGHLFLRPKSAIPHPKWDLIDGKKPPTTTICILVRFQYLIWCRVIRPPFSYDLA